MLAPALSGPDGSESAVVRRFKQSFSRVQVAEDIAGFMLLFAIIPAKYFYYFLSGTVLSQELYSLIY